MPKYPENRKPRSYKLTVQDILESAALEELAIAHLINAEAEKIQAFTGHYGDFLLFIPRGVAHGYRVLGNEPVYIVYFTNAVYDRANPDE